MKHLNEEQIGHGSVDKYGVVSPRYASLCLDLRNVSDCATGVLWELEGSGVVVAAIEWDEDDWEIGVQSDEAQESELLFSGKQCDNGAYSVVGGVAGAREDEQGRLLAGESVDGVHSREPERASRV